MFPVDIGKPFESLTVAGAFGGVLVTGLEPNAGYDVAQGNGAVTIKPGGGAKADSGGVLVIGALP